MNRQKTQYIIECLRLFYQPLLFTPGYKLNNKMLVLTLYLSCLRNDETKNIIMKPYAILSSSLYKLATEERPSLKDIIPLTSQSNRIVQFFSTQNKSFYEYGIMLCWHSSWNTKNLEYIIFKVCYILYLHKCYIKKERLSFKITRQVCNVLNIATFGKQTVCITCFAWKSAKIKCFAPNFINIKQSAIWKN